MEQLVRIGPNFPFGRGSLMRLAMIAARWDDFAAQKSLIDEGVRTGRPVVDPFIYLALSDRSDDLKRGAELYAQIRFPAQLPLWTGGPRRPGRIRVGYVCGEFRAHPTLYLMAGLFERHDRTAFEIFAFDNGGGDNSPRRARFDAAVERIIDITMLSDAEAAARIRAEEIDILGGFERPFWQSAPWHFRISPRAGSGQLSCLSGNAGRYPYMDYILADRVVIPESDAKYYSEKIVWLPHSYQINDDKRLIAETPGRAEAGLPTDGFIFCNFNHANKFTPATFALWMRILDQVPGSYLWLLAPAPLAQENLRREAMRKGIAPARLIFAEHLPFEKHLARLGLADLFLDGLPYGAHTTASDALWAGLPLITCRGNAFAGRVAASLLEAVGLPELVTQDAAAFEALALRLAREPRLLDDMRKRLTRARSEMPLFDTARTTRDIETAWRMMFERRAQRAESFAVPIAVR